ncbi:hypothetical protein ACP70R_016689 [Stipagrostis hirtigluma subsp. patula]
MRSRQSLFISCPSRFLKISPTCGWPQSHHSRSKLAVVPPRSRSRRSNAAARPPLQTVSSCRHRRHSCQKWSSNRSSWLPKLLQPLALLPSAPGGQQQPMAAAPSHLICLLAALNDMMPKPCMI